MSRASRQCGIHRPRAVPGKVGSVQREEVYLRAGVADLRAPSGMLKIAYSTCVLRRVLDVVARPVPLPGHWWIEVP